MTERTVPDDRQRSNDERMAESPSSTLDSTNERYEKHSPAAADVNQPPNGGFKAWSQVLGSFFLFFNSWYAFLATWFHSSYHLRNIVR